jgi:phosphatidylglycerol:prolipoprotein diacylglycerol transferase
MHPTLFQIPGSESGLQAYGFSVAVALITGWVVSLALARRDRLPADRLGTAYVVMAALALVGARGLWLFQHPDQVGGLGEVFQLQAGGMAVGGGLFIGLIVAFLYCQTREVPFWAWADCLGPALLAGVAIERLGAFMAGTDFGHIVATGSWFGVHFPAGSPVHDYQVRALSGLNFPPGQSMPVHPTQLYAIALAVVGLLVAAVVRRRRTFSGQVGLWCLGWYVVARMAIEDPFRVDASEPIFGPLRLGQAAALVLAFAVAAVYASRSRAAKQHPDRHRQWTGGAWSPKVE